MEPIASAELAARGLRLALAILDRYDLPVTEEEIRPTLRLAAEVLTGHLQGQAPSRGVELFIENIAVAAAARVKFGEPPLQREELEKAFEYSHWFFNSLWHIRT
jgi:hypothetical protein